MHRATVIAIAAASLAHGAHAQVALHDNGGLNPAAFSLSGVPAPAGTMYSEPQVDAFGETNGVAGFSTHPASTGDAYRFADDFTVPAHVAAWRADTATVYAYVNSAAAVLAPPFAAATVQLWDGPPDQPGSAVVYGDAAQSRLLGASPTIIHRIFNTVVPYAAQPDSTRPVWAVTLDLGATQLPPGDYWLDFQIVPLAPFEDVYVPAVTISAERSLPSWNALQQRPGGVWTALVDQGKPNIAPDMPQDIPFIVSGAAVSDCPADLTGDGQVNSADLAELLGGWGAPSSPADLNGDGLVNSGDLAQMLGAWGPC